MESSVQSMSYGTDRASRSPNGPSADRLMAIRHEMEYLNTIGKRFVAAFDRFQVHRALLAALQELYHFSACCILLKNEPFELFIIPCYPPHPTFLEAMIQRIASAASALNLLHTTPQHLAQMAYLDAPDELALARPDGEVPGPTIGSCLNIPMIVENHIIGMLSLFDEKDGTFDTHLLQMTTMIADYAAVALENVRLREREHALREKAELQSMRLELIIGSMAEGLFITDARGAITSLNRSAEQLLERAEITLDTDDAVPLRRLARLSGVPWIARLAEIVGQAQQGNIVKNQEIVAGKADDGVIVLRSGEVVVLLRSSDCRHDVSSVHLSCG